MEQYYAFIKNNRVENIAVFASQDEELADRVAQEQGYDDAIWVGTNLPTKHSLYNGSTFEEPTDEYLISIDVMAPPAEETPDE
jgi:hypothetical protein